jgi:hypothetical protein
MKLLYKIIFFLCAAFAGFSPGEATAQNSEKTIITNQEKSITIYPIPANNTVNIRLSPALKNEVEKVEIVNLIGRRLTEQTIFDRNSTDITFTNLSEFSQGIYMVVARDKFGKIVHSAKMVINR